MAMRNDWFIQRIHEQIDEILSIPSTAVRITINYNEYSVPTVDYTVEGIPVYGNGEGTCPNQEDGCNQDD